MGRLFFFLEKPVRLFPSNSHDCYICVANFLAVMLVTLGQGYAATKVFTILTCSIKYWESLIQSLQNLVVIPPFPTPGHASHQGNLGRIGLETFLTKVFPIFFFNPPPPPPPPKKKKKKKTHTVGHIIGMVGMIDMKQQGNAWNGCRADCDLEPHP